MFRECFVEEVENNFVVSTRHVDCFLNMSRYVDKFILMT